MISLCFCKFLRVIQVFYGTSNTEKHGIMIRIQMSSQCRECKDQKPIRWAHSFHQTSDSTQFVFTLLWYGLNVWWGTGLEILVGSSLKQCAVNCPRFGLGPKYLMGISICVRLKRHVWIDTLLFLQHTISPRWYYSKYLDILEFSLHAKMVYRAEDKNNVNVWLMTTTRYEKKIKIHVFTHKCCTEFPLNVWKNGRGRLIWGCLAMICWWKAVENFPKFISRLLVEIFKGLVTHCVSHLITCLCGERRVHSERECFLSF